MVPQKFITQNTRETYLLGQRLGKTLQKPAILCLYGELGSGKTTFIQGLAAGLGIKKRIVSPTFIFIRNYLLDNQKIATCFYHLDLYRLVNISDCRFLGIKEILDNQGQVVVIEWADKIRRILPKKRLDLYFKYLEENKREIKLIPHNN